MFVIGVFFKVFLMFFWDFELWNLLVYLRIRGCFGSFFWRVRGIEFREF